MGQTKNTGGSDAAVKRKTTGPDRGRGPRAFSSGNRLSLDGLLLSRARLRFTG